MSEKFSEWLAVSREAARLKDLEANLRRELVDELVGVDRAVADARYKFDDIEGNKVTVVTKLNKRLDKAVLGNVWHELSSDEILCVDMKPTLNAKHKKLEDDSLLLQAIVVTDGMPTIEVKPL